MHKIHATTAAERVNSGQTATSRFFSNTWPLSPQTLNTSDPRKRPKTSNYTLERRVTCRRNPLRLQWCDSHRTKRLRGMWKTTHPSPDERRNKSPTLWAQGRLGWGAWGLRWKHRSSWWIWSISAPQSAGSVNLNSYITGPLKTSIARHSRHIRVTLDKLHGEWNERMV